VTRVRRPLSSLVFALVVALGQLSLAPSATAVDEHLEWGTTAAPDATLKQGCRGYPYSYALTPPDGDWMLETFLIGPRGKHYGSGYFITGDPLTGAASWRLCRRVTKSGTYTIQAKLTVINGGDYYEGWLPETAFQLEKPHH
jgi:hypothetical protein